MRDTIKSIMEEIKPGVDFESSDSLMDDGIIDSFFTIRLMGILMERFNIDPDPEEIISENFNSIDRICDLVKRHGGI